MAGFKKRNNPAALAEQLEELTGKPSYDDPNEWKLTTDKNKNGSAIIRFLPAKEEGMKDFVKIYNHGFKNKSGRWFVHNCPTTLDRDHRCPVCEANSDLWATGIESQKKLASARKRKLSYWSNIYVIKDETNPEAEGKVYKFRFGQQIMDKIVTAAKGNPDLGKNPLEVTCVFEGANFMLKSKEKSGYANYDDSEFGGSVPLCNGDEDKLDKIYNSMHEIHSIAAEDKFDSYEKLKEEFDKFVGTAKSKPASAGQDALSGLDELSEMDSLSNLDTDGSTDMGTTDEESGFDSSDLGDLDDLDSLLDGLD